MKKIFLFLTSIFFVIFLSVFTSAHCPVCTVATGAAVAATRFYGLDDLIVGLFIGGFVVSTALWFNNILLRRNRGNYFLPYQRIIIILASLLLTFWTFYTAKLVRTGNLSIKSYIFGVDKLIVGTVFGTALSMLAFEFSKKLKKGNSGKVLFPFQTIIITLLVLAVAAFICWLLIK